MLMHITCKLGDLQHKIRFNSGISLKNTHIPVLTLFLLEVKNDHLIITSNNLNMGVQTKIPVKIKEEGRCAVEASVFSSAILNLKTKSDVELYVDKDKNYLVLKSDDNETSFNIKEDSEYPGIPFSASDNMFTIDCQKLINGIKSVNYAASGSDMKPDIASVFLYTDKEENEAVFVSTDAFRLAEKRVKLAENDNDEELSALIPVKNTQDLLRVLGNTEKDVKVQISEYQIAFINDDFYCVSKLIDGNFPDYRQIIPNEFMTEVVFLKQDIINLMKLNSSFLNNLNLLTIKISKEESLAYFTAENVETGKNETKIKCSVEGEDVEIKINQKYLQECLQYIPEDTVKFKFSTKKPLVITPTKGGNFTYVIMPVSG